MRWLYSLLSQNAVFRCLELPSCCVVSFFAESNGINWIWQRGAGIRPERLLPFWKESGVTVHHHIHLYVTLTVSMCDSVFRDFFSLIKDWLQMLLTSVTNQLLDCHVLGKHSQSGVTEKSSRALRYDGFKTVTESLETPVWVLHFSYFN